MALSRLLLLHKYPTKQLYKSGDIMKMERIIQCYSSSSGVNERLLGKEGTETVNDHETEQVQTSVLRRYTFKGIFSTLKEKIVGHSEEPKKIWNENSSSEVVLEATSESIMMQAEAATGEPEGLIQSSQVTRDFHRGNLEVPNQVMNETSDSIVDLLPTAEPQVLTQSLEVSRDIHCETKNMSTSTGTHVSMDDSKDVDQIRDFVVRKMSDSKSKTAVQSSKVSVDSFRNEKGRSVPTMKSSDNPAKTSAQVFCEVFQRQQSELYETGSICQLPASRIVSLSNKENIINNSSFMMRKKSSEGSVKMKDDSERFQIPAASEGSQKKFQNILELFGGSKHNQIVKNLTGQRNETMILDHSKDILNRITQKHAAGGSGMVKDSTGQRDENMKLNRCKDILDGTTREHAAGGSSMVQGLTGQRYESMILDRSILNGNTREHAAGDSSIKDLFQTIQMSPTSTNSQPSTITETDRANNKRPTKMKHSFDYLPNSDAKRKNSLKPNVMVKVNEESKEPRKNPIGVNQKNRNLNIVADDDQLNRVKNFDAGIIFALPFPTGEENKKEISSGNKVLVRFLRNQNEDTSHIQSAFEKFGDIVKIEKFTSVKRSCFKDAFVYFKVISSDGKFDFRAQFPDKEAVQKALAMNDMMVQEDVTIEALPLDDMSCNIPIPNLIGDPDVPLALVQNPTRTIKVKDLAPDTSLHDLEKALSFHCNGKVDCFIDSASSAAYVVFETEDDKERALAGRYICLSGTWLSMLRIDTPRTTVLRISNYDLEGSSNSNRKLKNIQDICSDYGQVKRVAPRARGVADVHYKLAEWPNMLNILNSINGLSVNDLRLHARPAPAFPPEIMKVLWSHPDERRHVLAVIQRLIRNLDGSCDSSKLTDTLRKCYPTDLE
ncbi:hypothetical protein ACFE04_005915 [Oxalis oulophora]